MITKVKELQMSATPISRGIAIGVPYHFVFEEDHVPTFSISPKDVNKEVARYLTALDRTRQQLKRLQKKLEKDHILEGVQVLEAQIEMLQDPMLTDEVEKAIKKTLMNAESVFFQVIRSTQKKFQSLLDPFFRERFKDIEDIYRRIMSFLSQTIRISLADIPSGSIVFSSELSASCVAEANASSVAAFVTESGGETSHAAIIAKAKGIPCLTRVSMKGLENDLNGLVIVDARKGVVIFHPEQETIEFYQREEHQLQILQQTLATLRTKKAKTKDGCLVSLKANIDTKLELDTVCHFGGEGVGLLRTEYLFLHREQIPSEEEQFICYRDIIKSFSKKSIVMRTFDFSHDKVLMSSHPFSQFRNLRSQLSEVETFKNQIRAIVRARSFGTISLMFPMVTSLWDLQQATLCVREVEKELNVKHPISIGCMIEVPSAAIVSDLLSNACDFLSIGTNDLVQYALATDRKDPDLGGVSVLTDPSILRLLQWIVDQANKKKVPVTVCGEMAADPRFTALLLGLGVKEFSVAPRMIPLIKNAVLSLSLKKSQEIAKKALSLSYADEIEEFLNTSYRKVVPEDKLFSF